MRGEQGFADKIEIYAAVQQPFGELPEFLVKALTHQRAFIVRAPMEPEALDRVDNSDPHDGLAPRHRRIHAGEMILNAGEFLIPRGLIVYRGRVIPLGLAAHGVP